MSDAKEDDVRAMLDELRAFSRGERKNAGRDEVASGPVLRAGGFGGSRALPLGVVAEEATTSGRRLLLRAGAGGGELAMTMVARGEFIFAHGDLRLEAADRRRGAAFAGEVARWLGQPLSEAPPDGAPADPVTGTYVKLGERRDADGVDWDLYKLFLPDADGTTEAFFRIAPAGQRALLAEKWGRHRTRLVRLFEDRFGHRRPIEPRTPVEVAGQAHLTVPAGWLVSEIQGHPKATNPSDECGFEVSCLPVPSTMFVPPLAEFLEATLASSGHRADRTVSTDRGDAELAWAEYDFESDDPHRDNVRRTARGRWLLASDGRVYLLVTFVYWVDDAGWAVPAWERIVDSLDLRGAPLTPDLAG